MSIEFSSTVQSYINWTKISQDDTTGMYSDINSEEINTEYVSTTGDDNTDEIWYTLQTGTQHFDLDALPYGILNHYITKTFESGVLKALIITNLSDNTGTITLPAQICTTNIVLETSGNVVLQNPTGWNIMGGDAIDINLSSDGQYHLAIFGEQSGDLP